VHFLGRKISVFTSKAGLTVLVSLLVDVYYCGPWEKDFLLEIVQAI